jgi:Mrp family chromosome partitioning ATPase
MQPGGGMERRSISSHIDRANVVSAAHAIVSLAQGLFYPMNSEPPRVVTFTGVERFNGCTWVCGMVAEALAILGGGRVCVVDANVRCPSVHRMFGLERDPAAAEAISEPRPVIGKRGQMNLWAATAPAAASSPMSVLASPEFKTALTSILKSFDHVLIDTPALGKYPDALQLRWVSDGIVLVVQAESTPRDLTAQVKKTMDVSQIPLLAAVLNRPPPKPKRALIEEATEVD